MTFALPICLLWLLPWAAVLAYLLRGVGQRAVVPFLMLWPKGSAASPRAHRRRPPFWILLLCLASLLAILAAAGPIWTGGVRGAGQLSIVIDRGITMSGDARYRDLLARCQVLIGSGDSAAAIALVSIPGQSTVTTAASWRAIAAALPPTAVDTKLPLQLAVTDQLRQKRGPVMVLTDQPVDCADSRVIRIAPDRPARNVGITALAARDLPHPQVMVRLNNDSTLSSVHLRVRSGPNSVDREVTGAAATVFIDMPALADTVTAEINGSDDIPADDTAWLTRQTTGITLDVTGSVPAEVRRIAAVFARNRPAGRHVLLSDLALPANQDGVQVLSGDAPSEPVIPLTTTINPLTRNVVAWPGPALEANPPSGFRIVVEREKRPLVAVRESSPHQVWINLNTEVWSQTTDFVVFFSNVFESFRSEAEFASVAPVLLDSEWTRVDDHPAPANVPVGLWPGLYRSNDGRMLAVNAPAVSPAVSARSSDARAPGSMAGAARAGVSLTPIACWCALLSIAAAMAGWPGGAGLRGDTNRFSICL